MAGLENLPACPLQQELPSHKVLTAHSAVMKAINVSACALKISAHNHTAEPFLAAEQCWPLRSEPLDSALWRANSSCETEGLGINVVFSVTLDPLTKYTKPGGILLWMAVQPSLKPAFGIS